MDVASGAEHSLDELAERCITQASNLQENVAVPKTLIYNHEAHNLVGSIHSELAELEDVYRQLQKLATDRQTHMNTVEVLICVLVIFREKRVINQFGLHCGVEAVVTCQFKMQCNGDKSNI